MLHPLPPRHGCSKPGLFSIFSADFLGLSLLTLWVFGSGRFLFSLAFIPFLNIHHCDGYWFLFQEVFMFRSQVHHGDWALLTCNDSVSHMLLRCCSASSLGGVCLHVVTLPLRVHLWWFSGPSFYLWCSFSGTRPSLLSNASGKDSSSVCLCSSHPPAVVIKGWLLCMLPLFPWRILLHMKGFIL